MEINGILGELGNGVDGSLFTDDPVVYIYITKNQSVAMKQQVEDKRGLAFSAIITVNMIFRKGRKKNEEPIEITLKNQIIPYKMYPFPGDDLRQHTELERTY